MSRNRISHPSNIEISTIRELRDDQFRLAALNARKGVIKIGKYIPAPFAGGNSAEPSVLSIDPVGAKLRSSSATLSPHRTRFVWGLGA
jgi:hypothetical protein